MIIDITKLNSGIDDTVEINENITIDSELLKEQDIIQLKNVNINGSIYKDVEGYYLESILSGTMVLPDSLTLVPTNHEFEAEISGNIEELLEEIGKNDKKIENTIDILPIIWENILMEIPIRVENEESRDKKLEGNGWKVITDDDTSDLNPELQKLKDLLK